jgi:hypothetical protein
MIISVIFLRLILKAEPIESPLVLNSDGAFLYSDMSVSKVKKNAVIFS